MIQLIIYLDDQHDPEELVLKLLKNQLAAKATIDRGNTSYFLTDNQLKTQTRNIITVQTRALLFSEIEGYLYKIYQKEIPICSMPITQSNRAFSDFIRANTKK